ncbi:Arm DNA-binding domain-containing protein [Thiothrix winogradskyi]|uniref:Arm DNA-binding domain-containing protein n=1 Tax=Thiothrix winogradskyi TaxID=96472 RepID=A0ABY3SXC6_9GAMM|nr:Arm DNA-binding domain-containing protein [Thiothrix winogradskyi]UJS24040.1 Arm DNA-binding domain-containing protein [Thiothrix winogradskyi]
MKRSLNDTAVKNAKPKDKEYKLSDGGGLYLLVKPNGSKLWHYKYKLQKEKVLSIGSYPEISLKDARLLHEEARALWARGVDPSQHKPHPGNEVMKAYVIRQVREKLTTGGML